VEAVARADWTPSRPVRHAGRREAHRGSAALPRRLGGPLCVVTSSASLQTAAALATTVFAVYGPAGTGALRFAVAAAVLLVVIRPSLRGRPQRFWLNVAVFGAVLAALNLSLYEAIARVPLSTAVTLQFLGPLALALLGIHRRLDVVWVLAASAGVVLLTGGPAGGSDAGIAFALLAAAITAASVLMARRVASESRGLDGLALAIAAAAVLTLPVAIPAAFNTREAADLAIVGAVGVLGIAVPYALEYAAIRLVSVKAFSVLLSLDPAIAALAGLAWLGQTLAPAELLGIGLVVAASAGVMGSRSPPKQAG
jgi:inner membrane transporter RhtA